MQVSDLLAPIALVLVLVLTYSWEFITSAFRLIKLLVCVKLHSYVHATGPFSFLDIFEAKVDSSPGSQVQFICAETGDETQLKDVEALANRVAQWGLKMGYKQLDTVAIMMLNSPEFVSIWLGFGKIGVSSALLNTNAVGKALIHSCEVALLNSKHKMLIVDSELKAKLSEDLEHLEAMGITVVVWNTDKKNANRDVTVEQEVALFPDSRPSRKHRDSVREKDTLVFIFTSGTTGLPKACKISQTKYYLASLPYRITCALSSKDRIYTTMPLYHSAAGMLGVGAALTCGAALVFRKKFSVRKFTSDCLKYKVTTFQYIGELCRYLISAPENPDDKLLSIRYAFGNGLKADYWTQFQQRYGVEHVVEFYGATEGNAGLMNNFDKVGALGFVPRILDLVYPLKIVRPQEDDKTKPYRDPKTGRCVDSRPNEVGLLLSKIVPRALDSRFDGYTDSKSSAEKVVHDVHTKGDAYFNTGDLLSRDWYGFYYWSDRVGDTFRWKGENVATSEVSSTIATCSPSIRDNEVYGVEVPGCEGRAGMAVVVIRSEAEESDEQILRAINEQCKKNLAAYAKPIFVRVKRQGDIPMTATFKHLTKDLVKQGFDPSLIEDSGDALYFYNAQTDRYEALDEEVHRQIVEEEMRL